MTGIGGAIGYAINMLSLEIPQEILNAVFIKKRIDLTRVPFLNEAIITTVIRPFVMTDINVITGIETVLNLDKCGVTYYDYTNEYVVDVPKSITNNKSIMSVSSIHIGNTYFTHGTVGVPYLYGVPTALAAASKTMNHMSNGDYLQTAALQLIGDNLVLVRGPVLPLTGYMVLRCMVEYDNNLSTLPSRAFPYFAELVALATKAYIYNYLVIKNDQAVLYGGHELGAFKDKVSEYADALTMYKEYRKTVWSQVAYMANSLQYHSLISLAMGDLS